MSAASPPREPWAYRTALHGHLLRVLALVVAVVLALALGAWTLGGTSAATQVLLGSAYVVPVLWIAARPATLVSADGIMLVPTIGRTRRYPWTAIEGFSVDSRAGRGAVARWPVARLETGRSVRLPGTGSDPDRVSSELNAALHRHVFHGEAPRAAAPAALRPTRGTPSPAAQLAIGVLIIAAGSIAPAVAINSGWVEVRLAADGVATNGVVIDKGEETHLKVPSCPLTYQFIDGTGATVVGFDDLCTSIFEGASLGSTIPILYSAADRSVNRPNYGPPDASWQFFFGAALWWLFALIGGAAMFQGIRRLRGRPTEAAPAAG